MKTVLLVILVTVAALFVARCSTPASSLRYRMTLVVETPSGIRLGSSVMELILNRRFLIPMPGAGGAERGGGFQVIGEAPFVDLGNGQITFVKFHGNDYRTEIRDAVLDGIRLRERRRLQSKDGDERLFEDLQQALSTEDVRPEKYPMLAMFADPSNPNTVREFPAINLAVIEHGYAVSTIKVEVVDANVPLTRLLATRFPALAAVRGLVVLNPGGKGQHY